MNVLQIKKEQNKEIEEIEEIIKNIDKNGDGVIDMKEFDDFMNK